MRFFVWLVLFSILITFGSIAYFIFALVKYFVGLFFLPSWVWDRTEIFMKGKDHTNI